MAPRPTVLLLPGDGIGPEVMREARRVLDWLMRNRNFDLVIEEDCVGGAALDAYGVPLAEATLARARAADAILFGAVGGPAWDGVGFDRRPELAIITLRQALGLYANLRPALLPAPLIEASPLKPDIAAGLDIVIVRESVGGIYFGEPRGIETLPDGQRRGWNTESYSTGEIERVARVAFRLARGRRGRVTSVEKANVMESGVVWRETVQALQAAEFPDVALTHLYADNCAMQLVRAPRQFDVILAGNLFGDLLSDLAGAITGSLGLLPSATLGEKHALFEPIHGSAPDIAGKGVANPLGMILCAAMMLRHALAREQEAAEVEAAVGRVLAAGIRTPDIARAGTAPVSTEAVGRAVIEALAAEPVTSAI